jgi:hypothetical protein
VVCGLSALQPVSMVDWGAVDSVSRHMTQTCADRQEDTSRLSRPVRSVALRLLTGSMAWTAADHAYCGFHAFSPS